MNLGELRTLIEDLAEALVLMETERPTTWRPERPGPLALPPDAQPVRGLCG